MEGNATVRLLEVNFLTATKALMRSPYLDVFPHFSSAEESIDSRAWRLAWICDRLNHSHMEERTRFRDELILLPMRSAESGV